MPACGRISMHGCTCLHLFTSSLVVTEMLLALGERPARCASEVLRGLLPSGGSPSPARLLHAEVMRSSHGKHEEGFSMHAVHNIRHNQYSCKGCLAYRCREQINDLSPWLRGGRATVRRGVLLTDLTATATPGSRLWLSSATSDLPPVDTGTAT